MPASPASTRRLLITAGPTHEPIDAVRYLGNRSSGRMGVALADEGARRGWVVTLLLGPSALSAREASVRTLRFRTAADLQGLLNEEFPRTDVIIMAAAVADYRPVVRAESPQGKIRREPGTKTLELESTPDLIAACGRARKPGQVLVAPAGFQMQAYKRGPSKYCVRVGREPNHTLHIPSVDVTMLSVAEVFGARSCGVILTGMGNDGAQGMRAIFEKGGITIGQDEASCVVYGMPKVCAEMNVLRRVAPLAQIPGEILQAARHS